MAKITIFGGGAWGKALAFAFSFTNEVCIVSRQNLDAFLKNTPTQNPISQVSFEKSLESDLFVNAIKTQALREWLKTHKIPNFLPMLFACKGIEVETGAFVSDIAQEFLDTENICFLAGPSFSKEVLQARPCALVIHSNNSHLAQKFANCLPNFIKTYIKDDVIGGEIAGAYKNVIAIASGICDGLELGNNARASLLARGLIEMHRFGEFFGAKMETFLGLSGAGDLFLSASSELSRNYRVGAGLAHGKKLETILQEIGEVAEGVISTKAIVQIAKKNNIYTPIATEIDKILQAESSIQESLRRLMC